MYLYLCWDFSETKLDPNYIPDTLTLAVLRNSRWRGKKTTHFHKCNFQAPALHNAYAGWLRDFECLQISSSRNQKSLAVRESHKPTCFWVL
jgi:hypothetical protein